MSGVVTSRVDPPDHLLRLVGICPWDGGWLGAFAAFGRDMSANVGRKRPGRRRPGRRGWLGAFAAFGRDMSLGWRVAGCVCRVWPGYVRKRRSQAATRHPRD